MTKEKLIEYGRSAALTFASCFLVEFYTVMESAHGFQDIGMAAVSAVTFAAARTTLRAMIAK